ncbi:MAG TPA: AAA family ATPase [Blastocatellia bacterium]|nr:AAA family ATPase [Blastocatellia bacterium]
MATSKVEGGRKLNGIELPFSSNNSLTDFTRDLTAAALQDELEPVTGRDREIDRVITILLRQSKNNPVLIGEAGVGKTAVVEGLAHRIIADRVPSALKNVSILSLSHTDLLAGASYRGQYEKRLKAVIDEASESRFIILFIDELHNLIGAGSAIGAPMDAANMLKPALANGKIRVIGATTEYEYGLYIRADAALERRFQPVRVVELGREQTLEALRARQTRLEMHHLLSITEGALEAATDLSLKHLPNRLQPDRSIDLLDETCARVRLLAPEHLPKEIVALQLKRDQLLAAEREAINQLALIAEAKGTSLERFSRGTYKMIEAMGLEVEKLFTGATTEREDLPLPDSVRRIQETDPGARLAESRSERLRIEAELKSLLGEYHLLVKADDVRDTVGPVA